MFFRKSPHWRPLVIDAKLADPVPARADAKPTPLAPHRFDLAAETATATSYSIICVRYATVTVAKAERVAFSFLALSTRVNCNA